MKSTVVIIPARGGSKGIPEKNLISFCGYPLLVWSIRQALNAKCVDSVWVTSDSQEILDVACSNGAHSIERPHIISGDTASSEDAWLHALNEIESRGIDVGWIIGMQATSPIREPRDISSALKKVQKEDLDSLLSVAEIEDFFVWNLDEKEHAKSLNYDYCDRKPRQQIEKRYLENGSFYIFRPEILRDYGNRLGGKIGIYVMDFHKMFQIDNPNDVILCESIMHGFGLDNL